MLFSPIIVIQCVVYDAFVHLSVRLLVRHVRELFEFKKIVQIVKRLMTTMTTTTTMIYVKKLPFKHTCYDCNDTGRRKQQNQTPAFHIF